MLIKSIILAALVVGAVYADRKLTEEPLVLPKISTNTITSPQEGMVIISTDTRSVQVFVGNRWRELNP